MKGKPSKQKFPAMDPNLGGIVPPNYADMILYQAAISEQYGEKLPIEKTNPVNKNRQKQLVKAKFKK